jgi:uncharacterized protein (TIGR00369 family)
VLRLWLLWCVGNVPLAFLHWRHGCSQLALHSHGIHHAISVDLLGLSPSQASASAELTRLLGDSAVWVVLGGKLLVLCWAMVLVSARFHLAHLLVGSISQFLVASAVVACVYQAWLNQGADLDKSWFVAAASSVAPLIAVWNSRIFANHSFGWWIGTCCGCNLLGSRVHSSKATEDVDDGEEGGGDKPSSVIARRALSPRSILVDETFQEAVRRGTASMVACLLQTSVLWKAFDHSIARALVVTRISSSRSSAVRAALALREGATDPVARRRFLASAAGANDPSLAEEVSAEDEGGRFLELEAEMEVTGEHCNTFGALHGGCVLTLVDVATTLAILALDCRRAGVTVDLSASVARPVLRGEKIRIIARVLSLGRRLAFTEADILRAADNKPAAFGRHTKAFP